MIHRLACLAFALTGIAVSAQTPARYDVVIRGGRVVDGTGRPASDGDVAIAGGRIVAVGRVADAPARLPLPLIMDGKVVTESLEKIDKTEEWLLSKLAEQGVARCEDVFYCSVNAQGQLYIDQLDS